MRFHWLNNQNNKKLIIFFAGWSFDQIPFKFLDCEDFDVMIVYDYSAFNTKTYISLFALQKTAKQYEKTYLLAWSMGVYVAYLLKDKLPNFSKKVAINGTPFPVDDQFGIPQKMFLLTLRHAETGLEGKFYQNVFDNNEEYERYSKTSVARSIKNRVEELQALYDKIKVTKVVYKDYYDKALVSNNDKIIPTKNQLNFWKDKAETIESGHFPFYNFKSWNEILCK
jgi:biotin synthesis protein BioG